MRLHPALRSLGLALGTILLTTAVGCGGKNGGGGSTATTTYSIAGKVTFDRIPLVRDAAGLPVGLETDPSKYELNKPARGIRVVLYKKVEVTDLAGATQTFYQLADALGTASDGTYTFQSAEAGASYMVEVQGAVLIGTSPAQTFNLVAEPDGLASTKPVINRLHYCLRKAPDGTLPPATAGANLVATSAVNANASGVDFHIGINDAWYLADTSIDRSGSNGVAAFARSYSPAVGTAGGYAHAGDLESTQTGSRVAAILDALYEVGTYSTLSTLAISPDGAGSTVDLHYRRGHSEPGGTYLAWDRTQYPEAQVYDPVSGTMRPTGVNACYDPQSGAYRYFGTIRGDESVNDDAWDRAPIMLLAARAYFFNQVNGFSWYRQPGFSSPNHLFPLGAPLADLDPQLALMEGFPEALVAVLQKSPYLADTTPGGVTITDIRDLSGIPAATRKVTSAAFMRPLSWELALKASGLPSPGTAADWANLKPGALYYFFSIGTPSGFPDTPSLYQQLSNLQTVTNSTTFPDVSGIFTNAAIQDLLATQLGVPANAIPWPRPTTGDQSTFVKNWGDTPNSTTTALPAFSLSMAGAVQVGGVYPNTSSKEVGWAQFTLTQNRIYNLGVALSSGGSPVSLTNGQVEIAIQGLVTPDGQTEEVWTLSTSTATPLRLTAKATNGTSTTYRVRVRMLSPTTLQPDTTVTLSLVPAS